jgi:hypothetical protein
MITFPTSQIQNPDLPRRPSIRNGGARANLLRDVNVAIDLPGLPQIPAPATDQSCAATSSANTLIGAGCPRPVPWCANLHSARRPTACHFPRVPSLKASGRRPRCKPHRCHRPASDTLNKRRHRLAHSITSSKDQPAPLGDQDFSASRRPLSVRQSSADFIDGVDGFN